MSLRSLLLTLLIAAVCWWWLRSRDLKELALQAVQKRCEELSLCMLDQTVALRRVRLRRNARGQVACLRVYQFEFSATGEERYQGHIELLGSQVRSIYLPPHRVQ